MNETVIAVWHDIVHKRLEIATDAWVGILAKDQRSTGMLDKDLTQAGTNSGSRNQRFDLRCDLNRPTALRRDVYTTLINQPF
jgi:hypothetical protein